MNLIQSYKFQKVAVTFFVWVFQIVLKDGGIPLH